MNLGSSLTASTTTFTSLLFEVIYELGCRVGEFVRIQIKHLNFNRSTVFFPAENTKTKHARISYLPKGLTNEIKSMLKQKGFMNKRGDRVRMPEAYLFHPGKRWNKPYTENRIRQIFQKYVTKAGLQQVYGKDTLGRNLKMFTVHSLRHSHVFHNVVVCCEGRWKIKGAKAGGWRDERLCNNQPIYQEQVFQFAYRWVCCINQRQNLFRRHYQV